jgi:methyl-accepting chemotaxis protein
MTDEQVQPKTIWEHAKSLGWLVRHALQFSGVMGIIYFGAGSVVKPHAQEVLENMLLENPAFKEMAKESDEQGTAIKKIESELKAVQGTLSEVQGNSQQAKNDINEIKGDVNRLVEALLNRRTSIENIPPWPSEVHP